MVLTAARNAAKATIALLNTSQLERADNHTAPHHTVGVAVERCSPRVPAVVTTLSTTVDRHTPTVITPEPSNAREHEGAVVHAPPPAEKGVQVRHELAVGQQVTEGL